MQLGMIGLGRMGANIVRRLLRHGHECVVYNRSAEKVRQLESEGATGAATLDALVDKLSTPRAVWVMLPAGDPTEQTIGALAERLQPGDIVIDGGNSYYKDDVRRARLLAERSIGFVDVGTSGGVWGLERGYCLMIGGEEQNVRHLDPLLVALAPGRGEIPPTPGRTGLDARAEMGYLHCGPVGGGHFVKMVHNGIEYGLMQAYAEGFDILRGASAQQLPEGYRYQFNLADIAEVWRRGSVVSSWLLDLSAIAMAGDPELAGYSGVVQDSGEGRWTVSAALEEAVPAEVLSAALYTRFRSRQEHTFAEKVLSAMRFQFGGHTEHTGK
ncbi:MAG: decarboxylating 6-phosphogluconate dehydrogenase [Aphanocapsa lilacina HA4352-LM1]|jgi:6-phosphogluconate dehydrogenase|nr:decarboxylating 6-phosphogluconate dehydrogenase [Aphanocapsa lilacina HA4352-LM1]